MSRTPQVSTVEIKILQEDGCLTESKPLPLYLLEFASNGIRVCDIPLSGPWNACEGLDSRLDSTQHELQFRVRTERKISVRPTSIVPQIVIEADDLDQNEMAWRPEQLLQTGELENAQRVWTMVGCRPDDLTP